MSKKVAKSIFGRVKELPQPRALPVLIHGDKVASTLHGICDRVVNLSQKRHKYTVEALKLSAAHHGAYSLSAN
jgi:hypothetical protein